MVPPYPPGMAPIQRLPTELKDLICEFAGFEAHRTRDYHVSRPDETLSQDDAYTWTPHSLMPDMERRNTEVYDDFRSLSLVSRDFTPSAQRALFTIVALPQPISYFRLLRSLLLNPQNGRYIRCLIPVSHRSLDNIVFREANKRALRKELFQMFTPTFCEEAVEILNVPNPYLFPGTVRSRLVVSWNPHPTALNHKTIQVSGSSSPTIAAGDDIEVHHQIPSSRFFPQLMSEALEAVIPLCPQLRAFHLLCRQAPPDALPFHSSASWSLSLPIGQTLFNSNPLLTTLTVDFRALAGALKPSRFTTSSLQRRHLLPATITHLSLIGHPLFDGLHVTPMSLFALGTWLSENHGLRSLRVLNGLAHTTHAFGQRTWNWNTILLRYKHSLEELELDGRGLLLRQPFSARKLLGLGNDSGVLDLFGEAKVLSCLGQMERLKVIKVPLHYLRRVRVQEWWDPMLVSMFKVPGVDIVEVIADEDGREVMEPVVRREQDIQVDVEFPVGAERIEVVVPGEVKRLRFPRDKVITGVRTVVVRGEEAGDENEEGAVQGAGVFH